MNTLDTEFCNVKYIAEDHVVFLTWKKFAALEDYRTPTTFALELLRKYENSQFIVDARNGFEDDPRDVEWGFSFLLPEMAKTTCQYVCFIMNEVNEQEIGAEMDMWTKEFGKYFAVTKSTNYALALESIHTATLVNVRYIVKEGMRDHFYNALLEEGIISASKEEPGNIKYDYYYPLDCDRSLCLMEMWTSDHAVMLHSHTSHYERLQALKTQYIEKVEIHRYTIKD